TTTSFGSREPLPRPTGSSAPACRRVRKCDRRCHALRIDPACWSSRNMTLLAERDHSSCNLRLSEWRLAWSFPAFALAWVAPAVTPTVESQDNEANNGAAATPLVAHLLEVAHPSIDAFHVIVGAHALGGWAVQVGDHFDELVRREHVQSALQVGVGLICRSPDQHSAPALCLVRALLVIEQFVDADHEAPQSRQFRCVAEHGQQGVGLALGEVCGLAHDEEAVLGDELGLVFVGQATPCLGALLGLAASAAAPLASATAGQATTDAPHGVEDAVVDVLEHVEDAQLVTGLRPDLGQQRR